MLPNVMIAAVVGAMTLRYFYVSQQWRRSVELEARARIHALQARIRPHFLFNSMNTIAALTRSNPVQAEEAIEDLSDLFRVSLSDARAQITLQEEIEIARTYQRIEQLRLGDRLQVRWDVGALPPRCMVPSLLLQPLLENAIGHGIEPLPQGGIVDIRGRLGEGAIMLEVTNPKPPGTPPPLRAAVTGWRSTTSASGWTWPSRVARPSKSDGRGPLHGPAAVPTRRGRICRPGRSAEGRCRAAFVTRGPVHRTIPVRAWTKTPPPPPIRKSCER
ncbi:MAG: histidine kinase [Proteobacteria bacterium]|nr:histidine kinase [Pseudomonadota bacterium]